MHWGTLGENDFGKIENNLYYFLRYFRRRATQWMDVGVCTLVLEMKKPLLSKNPCLFNCAWPGPCRADEEYAMLHPVNFGSTVCRRRYFNACEII